MSKIIRWSVDHQTIAKEGCVLGESIDPKGKYVLYNTHAAVIAAKDQHIDNLKRQIRDWERDTSKSPCPECGSADKTQVGNPRIHECDHCYHCWTDADTIAAKDARYAQAAEIVANLEITIGAKNAEIERFRSAYQEAHAGWKSAIEDLRKAAEIAAQQQAEIERLRASHAELAERAKEKP